MGKEIKDYLHLYLGCELFYGDEILVLNGRNLYNALKHNWKPILRPLSDMTEEEKSNYENKEWKIPVNISADIIKLEAEKTIFLLSKHFDLFGLIEAGLAIDKTTLK